MACTLRVIFINDVYELDLLPNFATAREIESYGANTETIGVLAGDFVAPSLLSSLDMGYGMVECMGASGINFCCIGK
jgi:5'-nucleotidase